MKLEIQDYCLPDSMTHFPAVRGLVDVDAYCRSAGSGERARNEAGVKLKPKPLKRRLTPFRLAWP